MHVYADKLTKHSGFRVL